MSLSHLFYTNNSLCNIFKYSQKVFDFKSDLPWLRILALFSTSVMGYICAKMKFLPLNIEKHWISSYAWTFSFENISVYVLNGENFWYNQCERDCYKYGSVYMSHINIAVNFYIHNVFMGTRRSKDLHVFLFFQRVGDGNKTYILYRYFLFISYVYIWKIIIVDL